MKSKVPKTKVPKILGFGYIDITMCLELKEEDITQYEIDLEAINSIQDLEFLTKNPSLLEKIALTSDSTNINALLYINKSNRKKSFIEYTSFNAIFYNDNETFLKEIVESVTERNFLFINELTIAPSTSEIKFFIKRNGNLIKEFSFGCDLKEKERENKESKENKNEENEDNKEDKVGKDGKEDKETPEPRDPTKFKDLINSDFYQFDYVYLDVSQYFIYPTMKNPGYVSLEELTNLLHHITINQPHIRTIVSYPSIYNYSAYITPETLTSLNSILSYTDVFYFEKKEAIQFFNLLNQINDPNFKEEKGKLNEKQLEKLFFASFITKRTKYPKLGLFNNDFTSIIVIEKHGNQILNNTYPLDLYPKVNHTNQKLIEEYKKCITIYKDLLKAIFTGGFLSKFVSSQGIVAGLFSATEITKRIIEIVRLDLEFPSDNEFYIINTKKASGNHALLSKQKEDKFVLDCINKNKSQLNLYNPLHDNNLFSFFSSNVIRKHLKHVGFINTKGFILEDPNRQLANSPNKDKINYDLEVEKERKLLIAIRESEERNKESVRRNLANRSKYLHDTSVKELERLAKVNDYNTKSHVLLPSITLRSSKLKPIKGYNSLMTNKSMDKVSF